MGHVTSLRAIRVFALALALLPIATPTDAAISALGEGPDAVDRQQFVYELNLARWNPVAYEARAGVRWVRPAARPPLALDDRLLVSAQLKADEMATEGYFSHQSLATGEWPNQLVREAGYPLDGNFSTLANNVESLHAGSPFVLDVLTSFAKSPTHMRHLFGGSWFSHHVDIGVGRSMTANFWVIHTAFGGHDEPSITGVVFDDADGDRIMDLGEGLSGVVVLVDGERTFTTAGGGFVVEVKPGSHRVTAFGGPFEGTATTEVLVGDANVGVDFRSGHSDAIVRAYELCDGREPTILGTSGDDVLIGTPGDDIIHGLGGRDIIDGRGGDDAICRGSFPTVEASIPISGSAQVTQPW